MALFAGDVEPERYLYHYTTRQAALASILPQAQLRLGPLTWTNDPRESQHWLVTLSSGAPEAGDDAEERVAILREADRLIKATTKLVCFTRDDQERLHRGPGEPFARGWAHSRMWAQYADRHAGVCLVFERDALARAVEELRGQGTLWDGPVIYANRPYLEPDAATLSEEAIRGRGLRAVVDEHVHRHWDALFFVKNEDWATEWEYRWVLRGRDSRPVFFSVAKSLAGIVVGPGFPLADARLLEDYAEDFGVSDAVGRCLWSNGFPTIVPGAAGGALRI